jgi:hypothetical protein
MGGLQKQLDLAIQLQAGAAGGGHGNSEEVRRLSQLVRDLGTANARQGDWIRQRTGGLRLGRIPDSTRLRQSQEEVDSGARMQHRPPSVPMISAPPAGPAGNVPASASPAPLAADADSVLTDSGESKPWSAVGKDERLDISTLEPMHWFECFEQKERGQKRLTRQMLVFKNGLALMNGAKFKWYRPHLLLNKMLVGDDEADLLVLKFGVGAIAEFTTDTEISARLLMSNREEVMKSLHQARMVLQGGQQPPQSAPSGSAPNPSSRPQLGGPRGPPVPAAQALPGAPVAAVDASAYESIIGQASLLGYSEAKVRGAARQLQNERKPPDLNTLLDLLERL